ncbi:MFS general substrate transporter [Peniophora sp. CONT]|nr:MFS general substrate transporter [Peniophora sp. CONT]
MKQVDQGEKPSGDPYQVVLEATDDPLELSLVRRWTAVATICFAANCVTCASSAASAAETQLQSEFGVSEEVAILGISLFVAGLAFGPLVASPVSEMWGRNIVYRTSFITFFAFNFAVAFAPNIAVYLVFRFVTGWCGAAFLSVAGGSVSDLFPKDKVATPVAVYTLSPFLGPEIGPLYSGFVNQHTSWRWTFYVIIIWSFLQIIALYLFVPETYAPTILARKAARLRKITKDDRYFAEAERRSHGFAQALLVSCYKPFELMLYDRIAFLINLWNSLVLGIIYLTFQAFPIIFGDVHGFSLEIVGVCFLGIALGMILALASQPYWNRRARRYRELYGEPPPEASLVMGQVGGVLVALGLYVMAFTTYKSVSAAGPIIGSIPFGAGAFFVFTSSFTYIVSTYRPIAASAMASNTAMRCCFAAGFPLFAGPMYDTLGTVGATALLAGLTTLMAPLPFIFHRYGAQLRERSRFAV